MNITKVLDQTEQMQVEWSGETITFYVRKASLTPNLLKNAEEMTGYPKALADVLTDWDITKDDEGNKWPLTEEEIGRLPVPLLVSLLGKVAESWSGNKKKSDPSPNTSVAAGA